MAVLNSFHIVQKCPARATDDLPPLVRPSGGASQACLTATPGTANSSPSITSSVDRCFVLCAIADAHKGRLLVPALRPLSRPGAKDWSARSRTAYMLCGSWACVEAGGMRAPNVVAMSTVEAQRRLTYRRTCAPSMAVQSCGVNSSVRNAMNSSSDLLRSFRGRATDKPPASPSRLQILSPTATYHRRLSLSACLRNGRFMPTRMPHSSSRWSFPSLGCRCIA